VEDVIRNMRALSDRDGNPHRELRMERDTKIKIPINWLDFSSGGTSMIAAIFYTDDSIGCLPQSAQDLENADRIWSRF